VVDVLNEPRLRIARVMTCPGICDPHACQLLFPSMRTGYAVKPLRQKPSSWPLSAVHRLRSSNTSTRLYQGESCPLAQYTHSFARATGHPPASTLPWRRERLECELGRLE
jgi:hypothetical protein